MTFQVLGVGMISLSVAVGVVWVFQAGLMILDGGDGEQQEWWKMVETTETIRKAADNWDGQWGNSVW
jgi:hypothetical protein